VENRPGNVTCGRQAVPSGARRNARSDAKKPDQEFERNDRRGHLAVAPSEVLFGGVLLSHILSGAVPLALAGLTSGFGMGPGVSLPLWPP
jgi:hypothetical protein